MTAASAFQPDWVSPPGATILDLLEERGSTVGEFATATQRSIQEVSALLYGSGALNEAWAQQLSFLFGASPTFWLRREEQYRSNLERLTQSADDVGAQGWLSELPIADMVKFGWVEKGKNKGETLANALAFFGVPSVESWRSHYKLALESAVYRTSAAFDTRPGAVAAWLRRRVSQYLRPLSGATWQSFGSSASTDAEPTLRVLCQPHVFLKSGTSSPAKTAAIHFKVSPWRDCSWQASRRCSACRCRTYKSTCPRRTAPSGTGKPPSISLTCLSSITSNPTLLVSMCLVHSNSETRRDAHAKPTIQATLAQYLL